MITVAPIELNLRIVLLLARQGCRCHAKFTRSDHAQRIAANVAEAPNLARNIVIVVTPAFAVNAEAVRLSVLLPSVEIPARAPSETVKYFFFWPWGDPVKSRVSRMRGRSDRLSAFGT